MNQTLILGLLRHALQLASGVAVACGWVAESDVETLIGALLSAATFGWYALDRLRTVREVKVADAVGQMGAAVKGIADAVTVAAVSQPTQALRDAAAEVPNVRAAVDRATSVVAGALRS